MEKMEGIIIKNNKYLETSKIIYCLTSEGIKSFLARGACKLTSKNNSYTQNITKISFDYAKGKGFDIITSAQILDNFNNIKTDFDRMQYAYLISELILHFTPHVTNVPLFYSFCCDVFSKINDNKHYKEYYILFSVKLLYLLGVGPELKLCVKCGSKTDLIGFDINSGGMICNSCHGHDELFYNQQVIKVVKYLYYTKINDIKDDILDLITNFDDICIFINSYYEKYLGFKSQTFKVIKSI